MSTYLLGSDILGADWGVPVVMDEADIGIPTFVDDVTGDVVEDTEAVVENEIRRMETELSDEFDRVFENAADDDVVGRGGGHGGGGHGGGHGGHGHGGHGGGRGFRGGYGGWGGAYPYYVDTVDCEYDQFGNCIPVTPLLVVGAFDFNVEQRKMDQLKVVPVSVAQALLAGGQAAIDGAIQGAKKDDLPGDNSRSIVKGKLQWHANALASLANTPNAIYASGPDLKHWTMMAFRESNAVEAGAQYVGAAWSRMWQEIAAALKALPAEIRKQVGDVVKLVTGLPLWAWGAIAAGTLVAIGGAVYALANTKAGAAAVGMYTGGRFR